MNEVLVSLPLYQDLATEISEKQGSTLIIPEVIQFADGEIEIRFSNLYLLAQKKIILLQGTCPPVHENIMLLLLTLFELKNAGAQEIIVLMPYFGYSRHDKGVIAGSKGSAALITKIIEASGASKIITIELHSKKDLSYFSIPIINIDLSQMIAEHIQKNFSEISKICLVAPDDGAKERVEKIAKILGLGIIFFEKKRSQKDKTEIVECIKKCDGKVAIIIDDIIDTGGTAINACNALINMGFKEVYGYFIHPVLSGDAIQKIENSKFTKLFVSNTIPLKSKSPKIEVVDVSNELLKILK